MTATLRRFGGNSDQTVPSDIALVGDTGTHSIQLSLFDTPSPPPTLSPPAQADSHRWPRSNTLIATSIVAAVCSLGAVGVLRAGWSATDDGAGAVPLVALIAIVIASVRWRPDRESSALRPVSRSLAVAIPVVGAAVAVAIATGPIDMGAALGPCLTIGLFGTYLALFGHRAPALLRTVTILSTLTWIPVASFAHDVVRSSLSEPSDLLYQRLARLPMLGITDEPWRLFTASLHRGSLVVIATILLAVGANRWRLSASTVRDLALTSMAALIVHHTIILALPIDDYRPTDVTQLATNPVLEIAVAALAVAGLSFVRWRRSQPHELASAGAPASMPTKNNLVDPFIFSGADAPMHPLTTAALLVGLAPLLALSIAA